LKEILGVIETEPDELVPLTDDFISSVCQDIHNRFPKVKRKRLSREEIKRRCHLQVPEEFHERYLDILCKHQDALSIDKYDLGLAKDRTKFTSKRRIRSTGNNLKFLRPTNNSLSKHWTNG
jgi:hypothetical protein